MAFGRRDPSEEELPRGLQIARVCAGPLQSVWVLPGQQHRHRPRVSRSPEQGQRDLGSLEICREPECDREGRKGAAPPHPVSFLEGSICSPLIPQHPCGRLGVVPAATLACGRDVSWVLLG